jgi:hypothetical protein
MTVATTSPGYASTVRVGTPPKIGATADLASAIMAAGGSLTALDVVKSNPSSVGVETMVIVPFGGDTTANNSMIAETRRLPLGGTESPTAASPRPTISGSPRSAPRAEVMRNAAVAELLQMLLHLAGRTG